jgi:RNA polymerase sigma-70 factor, ECF subfamily
MPTPAHIDLEPALVHRLYQRSGAERWHLRIELFAEALAESARKGSYLFSTGGDGGPKSPKGSESPKSSESSESSVGDGAIERYLESLHLEDLALATACAHGHEPAWEHFVQQTRPALRRAAVALDASGGAQDLADGIYAELFGVRDGAGERRSLFRYFHGRSSVVTWLRAVLAQRVVDRVRATRRHEPLPEEQSPAALAAPDRVVDPERRRHEELMQQALRAAIAGLEPRDRLRLGCYHAQELTLAQTGRILREHEATVSRQLARTRRDLRADVERRLREAGLSDDQIAACVASLAADPGPLDVGDLMGGEADRKESPQDRSKIEKRRDGHA